MTSATRAPPQSPVQRTKTPRSARRRRKRPPIPGGMGAAEKRPQRAFLSDAYLEKRTKTGQNASMRAVLTIQAPVSGRHRSAVEASPAGDPATTASLYWRTPSASSTPHISHPSQRTPVPLRDARVLNRLAFCGKQLYNGLAFTLKDSAPLHLLHLRPLQHQSDSGRRRSCQKVAASRRHLHTISSGFADSLRQHSERSVDRHGRKRQQTHPWLTLGNARTIPRAPRKAGSLTTLIADRKDVDEQIHRLREFTNAVRKSDSAEQPPPTSSRHDRAASGQTVRSDSTPTSA